MLESERLLALEAWVLRLREELDGLLLLVEGKRDVQALAELGIEGPVERIHAGRNLADRVEELLQQGSRRWVPLLDDDRTGNTLLERVESLVAGRVAYDRRWRQDLMRIAKARCIEDLAAEIQGLRARIHPKGL